MKPSKAQKRVLLLKRPCDDIQHRHTNVGNFDKKKPYKNTRLLWIKFVSLIGFVSKNTGEKNQETAYMHTHFVTSEGLRFLAIETQES